ncbi:MAG: ECF transporter S component [Oscillospiraceae bacterium]|nr:ECF transporter S component [Oscillospiraceae bacterium]
MSKNRFNTRALVFAGVCVALGVVLPVAFHSLPDGGRVFLPMHIPVLLCGLLCGPWYGLGCGVLAPALSHLITGMPMAAALPGMLCELAVYGLVSGLVSHALRRKGRGLRVYTALVCAQLAGRIVAGLVNGFIFMAGSYSLQMWLTASFVTALPGIIAQLLLLPVLVLALEKAGIRSPAA